jgi:hypothetical protein
MKKIPPIGFEHPSETLEEIDESRRVPPLVPPFHIIAKDPPKELLEMVQIWESLDDSARALLLEMSRRMVRQ